MEPRNLTWGQSLKVSGYNIKYKALSFIEESNPAQILPNFQQLYLLGEKYSANPDNHKLINELIYKMFSSTPWITYRTGFKEVKNKTGESFVTDAGWGCMIRAGQMYFAQILKKHLKLEEKAELYEIMKLFDDSDEEAMFSIQNIAKLAQAQYQLQPGVWYNPSQISFILGDIFDTHPKNPFKKTLASMVMNNSSLIFDQIVQKMTNKQNLCDCKKQYAVCYKCDKLDVSVAVIIMSRIGLDEPQPKYLRLLSKMMQIPYFQGFIGGKPGKALFVLDPHMPQVAVTKSNFQKQKQTYFCKKFRSCKAKDMDPSMGISFYLHELKDIDEFYKHMLELKKDNEEDFYLFMSLETPDFMKPGYKADVDIVSINSDEEKDQDTHEDKQKPENQKQSEGKQ